MSMPRARSWGLLVLGLVSLSLLTLHVMSRDRSSGGSASPGSFQDIVAANSAEYAGYQVKFTHTGAQEKTSPTLLLAGSGRTADVSEFTPYRTPGVHYSNDDDSVVPLSVAGSTIEKIVGGISDRSHLQSGGSSDPKMSIMIERGAPPSEIVWEHLADPIEASELINILQGAARGESVSSRETIRRFRNYTVGPN